MTFQKGIANITGFNCCEKNWFARTVQTTPRRGGPINLNHLTTFVAIVKCRSLSRAAVELHLTQPAVTKHVQALENHFGHPLLHRSGREVQPTEEGVILYRQAVEALQNLAVAETAMAEVGATVKGSLRIGASTIPGQYVLPYLVGLFRGLYSAVDLHLEIADTGEIVRRVTEEKVDVGVIGSPPKDKRLNSFPFLEDELMVVMPSSHPLANQNTILGEEFAREPLVWREEGSGTRKSVEERLARVGIHLNPGNVVIEVGSTEAVVAAVEAGLGLSVVSRWAVRKPVALGLVVAKSLEDVDLKRQLFVIYPRHPVARAVSALVEFLQNNSALEGFGQLPGEETPTNH